MFTVCRLIWTDVICKVYILSTFVAIIIVLFSRLLALIDIL